METPHVSVLIVNFNYAQFIGAAIESVLNSSYSQKHIQLVVVDDGSTDNSSAVITSYADSVTFIEQSNQGKAAATSAGLKAVTGKYCFFLDADDYYLPDRISQAVNIFENNPDVVHVSHPALYREDESDTEQVESTPVDLLGMTHPGKELLRRMYQENITVGAGSTFSARMSIIEELRIPSEVDMYIDEFLLLSTLMKGDSCFLKEPLSVWRKHGKNFSKTSSAGSQQVSIKDKRTLSSMKAVLESLKDVELSAQIRTIYCLKLKAAELHIKERYGQKQLSDIIGFVICLLKAMPVLGTQLCKIVRRYSLLGRLLPTTLLSMFRTFRRT